MRLSIGCDHGGYDLKVAVMKLLENEFEFVDCGTNDNFTSCDYPDFAIKAAELVKDKSCDYGVVICKSGIGVSIAANKVEGIRCALVSDVESAILTKQHNNANMLAMGATKVDAQTAVNIIKSWLEATFLEGRHTQRIEKISSYEQRR